MTTIICFGVAILCILLRDTMSPGYAGLALMYALATGVNLQYGMVMSLSLFYSRFIIIIVLKFLLYCFYYFSNDCHHDYNYYQYIIIIAIYNNHNNI
jgi:hypothetical protein